MTYTHPIIGQDPWGDDLLTGLDEFDTRLSGLGVNVKQTPYNAVGDGVADDGPAIQSAINAVEDAGGGIVFLPAGTYLLRQLLYGKSNVSLKGAGAGATTLIQGIWPTASRYGVLQGGDDDETQDATLNLKGTMGPYIRCNNIATGAYVISGLPNTTGIQAGDIILIGSDSNADRSSDPEFINPEFPSGLPHKIGELAKVKNLGVLNQSTGAFDNPTTSLTIEGITKNAYHSGASVEYGGAITKPFIAKINPVRNVTIEGIAFTNSEPGKSADMIPGTADYDVAGVAAAGSHATAMIYANFTDNVQIHNCSFSKFDSAAILFQYSYSSNASNNVFTEGTDNSPNSQWGYAVLYRCANESGVVANNLVGRCRHAFTTGSQGAPGYYGGPYNINVVANTITECTDSALDTHAEGGFMSFIGNTITGTSGAGMNDQDGAGQGAGFHIRAPNCSIIGNKVSYVTQGVTAGGLAHNMTIMGNHISNALNDFGIVIGSVEGYDLDRIHITDNVIEQTGAHAIYFTDSHYTNVTVARNTIINPGCNPTVFGLDQDGIQFGGVSTGSKIRIFDNLFFVYPAGAQPGTLAGHMRYMVTLNPGITEAYIVNNKSIGGSTEIGDRNGLLFNDATGVTVFGNQRLDMLDDPEEGQQFTNLIFAEGGTMQFSRGSATGGSSPMSAGNDVVGSFHLVAGEGTVYTTAIKDNSMVILTAQESSTGGNGELCADINGDNLVPGVSFKIVSKNVDGTTCTTDDRRIAWMIVNI